jgi:hypothetical protein
VKSRDWQFWAICGGTLTLGVGLLVVAAAVAPPRFWNDLLTALGTALLIASLLAATVDFWLKRALLRDAFKTLFGFLLPEVLRGELHWISTQQLLCDRLDVTLTLTTTDDPEMMLAHCEWRQDLRNITSSTVPFRAVAAADKWFRDGRESRIIAIRCTYKGITTSDTEALPSSPFITGLRPTRPVVLGPNEAVTVVTEGEEPRHPSDAFFLNLTYATARTTVTVKAPAEFGRTVMFGNRERVQSIGADTWELPGTMLPGHVVQVRWWPAADAA